MYLFLNYLVSGPHFRGPYLQAAENSQEVLNPFSSHYILQKKSPKGLDFSLILRHPLFKILGSFMSFCECSKSPFTALKEMGGLKREHGHYSVDVNYHHQGRDLFLEVFWSVLKGWGAALEINNFKRIAKKNTCMEHTHPNCGLAPRDILCLSKLQPYISAAEQTPFLPGVIVISKQLNLGLALA